MTFSSKRICVITPLANEAEGLSQFVEVVKQGISAIENCHVYFIIDNASKDNTLQLCNQLAKEDNRFHVIWAPENKNVVDAYLKGYKEVCNDYDYVIEMDAGLSHNPLAIPEFVRELEKGNDIVYGSRFIKGGKITNAPISRWLLSRGGTIMTNLLLGTNMYDMTSGFIGMKAEVAKKFVQYNLLSKGHFYQTELRYLLRKYSSVEIPIHYQSPSKRVSKKSITNSFNVLYFYFLQRLKGKPISIQ